MLEQNKGNWLWRLNNVFDDAGVCPNLLRYFIEANY